MPKEKEILETEEIQGNGKDPDNKPNPTQMFHAGYNEGKNKGFEKGKQEILNELKEKYGIDSLDKLSEIKEKLSTIDKKKVTENEEYIQKLNLLAEENKQLKQSLQKIEIDRQHELKRNSILAEVSRQNPMNKNAAELVTNEIFNNFEIKDGKIYKIGEEMPYLDSNNQLATLETVIADLKSKDFSFAFKREGGINHINDFSGSQGITNYKVDPKSDFFRPGFRQAIKESGQWDKVINDKPIDLTKLKVDYKQFGLKF